MERNKQAEKPRAADVARYLLEKKGTLTGFQLQKLLYYCQAWSLTVDKRPLFDDEIKAYEHGPVIPSVSMQHKRMRYVHPCDVDGDARAVSGANAALVDVVLAAYDGMTGEELEELSHDESPWVCCYNMSTGINSSATITHDSMASYYSKLLASTDETRRRHHVPEFDHPANLYVAPSDYDWLQCYLTTDEQAPA